MEKKKSLNSKENGCVSESKQHSARLSAGTPAPSTHMIIKKDVLAAYIHVYVFRWHSACSHIDWDFGIGMGARVFWV